MTNTTGEHSLINGKGWLNFFAKSSSVPCGKRLLISIYKSPQSVAKICRLVVALDTQEVVYKTRHL